MTVISSWLLRSLAGQLDALGKKLDAQQATLQQLNTKVDAMSDMKTNIANLQSDFARFAAMMPQLLDEQRQLHDAQGNAIAAADLQAIQDLHTQWGAQLDTLQAALPASAPGGASVSAPAAGGDGSTAAVSGGASTSAGDGTAGATGGTDTTAPQPGA